MTTKIIYGTVTESIEDYDTAVVLLVPDEMDAEELETALRDDYDSFAQQTIVTWEDVRDSFNLALQGEGIDRATIDHIILTVSDAIANND